ncbi:MAG: adenosine deaminase [Herbiconiux sp.]|uniref:adenosine deaminase n=1 Tax=Herbiconiux sp. TaxID=1871186 RepID=UPI0011FBDA5D|nr:adenosine deaminase [Herbiconiux sp.]TAJ50167.1 MAG: adenosine deaminase [Herbiconiux sp.]
MSERTYPKIELHVHLEGAVRPATLFELAHRNGAALPVDTLHELERFYDFRDFDHFIDVWTLTTNVITTADDFRQVVVDYAREGAGFGVVYLEGIFSPGQYYARGIESRALFEGYTDGIQDAYEQTGVIVRLTPDIDRESEPELSRPIVEDSIRFRDRGIVGVGLGGRERAAPTSDFAELFARARDGGLASVPHAGEDVGAPSVREAVDLLGADRIRHGFRAIEDLDLIAELRDRSIVLDVCPTSNLRTRVVPRLDAHPLPTLLAQGLQVTINTDDPAMFGTDLGTEHAFARSVGADPRRLFDAGVAGQVAGPEMSAHLRAVGVSHWGEPGGALS